MIKFFTITAILICFAAVCTNKDKGYSAVEPVAGADGKDDDAAVNYANYCSGCHGAQMDMFVDRGWKHGSTKQDIFKGIKFGYPDEGMPAFAETFTDKEIEELSDYILKGIEKRDEYNFENSTADTRFTSQGMTIRLDTVVTGIAVPWGMAFLPDGSILVTDRGGTLYNVKNRNKQEITGVPEVVAEGQGGLLDVALHPDFSKNKLIYLSYSKPNPENSRLATTAVMQAKLEGNKLSGQKVIFEALPYSRTRHHYGSRLVFDRNGYLFISVGERGNESENPQDVTDNQLGKIHRINADGSIPADNPFKDKNGKPTTLYSYGNRNPQGMALHPETGVLWANEHGPRGGDEINIIEPGKNYGWPVVTYGINYNGTTITDKTTAPGIQEPVHYWTPSIGPSGMAFVTGERYKPWNGAILTGALRFEYLNLSLLKNNQVVKEEKLLKNIDRVRDVRMAPDGYIYVAVEKPTAVIFRLTPVR